MVPTSKSPLRATSRRSAASAMFPFSMVPMDFSPGQDSRSWLGLSTRESQALPKLPWGHQRVAKHPLRLVTMRAFRRRPGTRSASFRRCLGIWTAKPLRLTGRRVGIRAGRLGFNFAGCLRWEGSPLGKGL